MDACKAAVKALRNSPAAMRRKISSSSSRMHKLKEDWLNEHDAVLSGITFFVKFLGYVETTCVSGQACTDHSVRVISTSAKQQKEKLEKISIRVSAKSIKIATVNSPEVNMLEFPIYRVTYCTVDSHNDKVMAFIAQSPINMDITCYAFLCNKKSKAWAIMLSIAQAFDIAFEEWEKRKERRMEQTTQQRLALEPQMQGDMRERNSDEEEAGPLAKSCNIPARRRPMGFSHCRSQSVEENGRRRVAPTNGTGHYEKDSDPLRTASDTALSDDELDTEFTRLALSRSTPNLLDTGLVKEQDTLDDFLMSDGRENMAEFRNGENNPAVLYRMVSREDLLVDP